MNETRDLYFNVKTDTDGSKWLDLKQDVKSFYDLKNEDLKNQIIDLCHKDINGLFYKGFRVCFMLNNEKYFIIHEHENEDFIKNLIEILKYHNAENIIIKYGELD